MSDSIIYCRNISINTDGTPEGTVIVADGKAIYGIVKCSLDYNVEDNKMTIIIEQVEGSEVVKTKFIRFDKQSTNGDLG